MLIVCLDCVSSYPVGAASDANGRRATHCAHCRRALHEGSDAAIAEVPARESSVLPSLLICGLVLISLSGLFGWRGAIAAAVPGAGPVYRLMGIGVGPAAPVVTDVRTGWDGDHLTVTATVANRGTAAIDLPVLRVMVRDGNADTVYSWTAPPPRSNLGPGESVSVTSRLDAPPAQGRDVAVGFAADRVASSAEVPKGAR